MQTRSSEHDAISPMLGAYQTVVEAFEVLGLTKREASVYVTLLVKEQMKAGDLARELKIHRLDVYNILKSLQQKDMVVATLSKPMLFKAVPMDSVLELLGRKHSANVRKSADALDELDRTSKRFSEFIEKSERERDDIIDRLQVISGRRTINERWKKLLSSAEFEILIATTERDTAQLLGSPVLDIISTKMERGVKVNVYSPETGANFDQFLNLKEQVRHLKASSSGWLCIIDRKKAMMVLVPSAEYHTISKKDETAVLIDSRSIGEMLGTLFFVGWDTSPLIEDAIVQG